MKSKVLPTFDSLCHYLLEVQLELINVQDFFWAKYKDHIRMSWLAVKWYISASASHILRLTTKLSLGTFHFNLKLICLDIKLILYVLKIGYSNFLILIFDVESNNRINICACIPCMENISYDCCFSSRYAKSFCEHPVVVTYWMRCTFIIHMQEKLTNVLALFFSVIAIIRFKFH